MLFVLRTLFASLLLVLCTLFGYAVVNCYFFLRLLIINFCHLTYVFRLLSVVLLMFKMSESSSNHSLSVFVASIYGVLVFY